MPGVLDEVRRRQLSAPQLDQTGWQGESHDVRGGAAPRGRGHGCERPRRQAGLRGPDGAGRNGAGGRPAGGHGSAAARAAGARRRLRGPPAGRRGHERRGRGGHHRPPDGVGPGHAAPGRGRGDAEPGPGRPRRRRPAVRASLDLRGVRARVRERGHRRVVGPGRRRRRRLRGDQARHRRGDRRGRRHHPGAGPTPGRSSVPATTSVWNTLRPAQVRDDEQARHEVARRTFRWVHVDDLAALVADVALGRIATATTRPTGRSRAVAPPSTWRASRRRLGDYLGHRHPRPRRRAGLGGRSGLDRSDLDRPGPRLGLDAQRQPRRPPSPSSRRTSAPSPDLPASPRLRPPAASLLPPALQETLTPSTVLGLRPVGSQRFPGGDGRRRGETGRFSGRRPGPARGRGPCAGARWPARRPRGRRPARRRAGRPRRRRCLRRWRRPAAPAAPGSAAAAG